MRAAVLGLYAGQDVRVNATGEAARAALEAADLAYRIQTFTEAGHAFFNDTGARFNAPAVRGIPSITPSIDHRGGLRCHFWLSDGRIRWSPDRMRGRLGQGALR